jgi:hypothetical protein
LRGLLEDELRYVLCCSEVVFDLAKGCNLLGWREDADTFDGRPRA